MTEQILQNDPNLKLPPSVLAASARADELYRTMRDQPEEPEITSEGNPDTDPAALAQSEEPKPAEKAAEKPAERSAEKPAEKAAEKLAEGDETWEHKYKSLHGRFVRQGEQIRSLSETVQNLQGVIATMQATTPVQSAPPAAEEPERLITAEEAADYGEDFLKVVGKRAREEFAPIAKQYQAEIERLKKQLEGVSGFVQQDTHAKLLSNLDTQLPNWRELNTNQDFIDWLSLPDPYSGAIRHDMLKAAYAQGNAPRVLAFFKGFLAEEAAVAPARAEPDPQVTTVPKVPLSSLAAPGRAKTAASASAAPAEKPIFTRAQIAAFYADVAQGKFRGRDADKNAAEAQIFAAQREGRIR